MVAVRIRNLKDVSQFYRTKLKKTHYVVVKVACKEEYKKNV